MTISNAGTCNSLVYQYNNQNFYPINGQGFGNFYDNGGTPDNYAFTFAFHGRFTYQGTEQFSFAGDDDVFVFINNQLALDLGGVHSTETASFDLSYPSGRLSIQDPLDSLPGGCSSPVGTTPPCVTSSGSNTAAPCACILGLVPGKNYGNRPSI